VGGRLDPDVAALRVAVRDELADLAAGSLALVACSGGPDSLALAAAAAFVAPRAGLRAGAVVVDHGLQAGSAAVAAGVAAQLRALGLDPGEARSLAGMPRRRGPFRRPLLDVSRAQVLAALAADALTPWDDPTNADPAFTRNRVRHEVLPLLERALGPGIDAALARTAKQLRDDAEALDVVAAGAECGARRGPGSWDTAALARMLPAVRSRVLRIAAGGTATAAQVEALDALITRWSGQGSVALPGGRAAVRQGGRLHVQ
jgi:tRNA(Ile)-lysidine synthase TilS/MesJ